MHFLSTYTIAILGVTLPSILVAQPAGYSCDPSVCRPPSCRCPSTLAPIANPPQFLLLSYDDSIQSAVWDAAWALVANRRNPNGCPVSATWFAQVLYSDPALATRWYAAGHEIADHSVTHGEFSGNIFAGTYEELEGMRAWANRFAGIPLNKIKGVRFPFRNFTVESLSLMTKMGFEYDSSMSAQSTDRFWPYTLDNGAANQCYDAATIAAFGQNIITACGSPNLNGRGLWEIPLYGFSSPTMSHLMDPFNDPSISNPVPLNVIQQSMRDAFDATYNGNRIPFGIYLHPTWMSNTNAATNATGKLNTIQNVISYAMSRDNVWMVTYSQLLEWMKNPVPASQLGSQPYMQCNRNPAPPTNICNGVSNTGVEQCPFSSGAFSTCYGCPEVAPSLSNPTPRSSSNRCPVPKTCDPLFWDPVGCTCTCSSPACAFVDTGRPINLDPSSLNTPTNPGNTSGNGTTPGPGKNQTNTTTSGGNGFRDAATMAWFFTGLVGILFFSSLFTLV